MFVHSRKNWMGYLLVLCGMGSVTALYRFAINDVNATTIALSFLLVILAVASTYGMGPAIFGSIAGMLCFNFFFLPPLGALAIHDAQNWVALIAFLATAVTASQLSSAARHRAQDAERRREEVWKLYELSRAIIATPDSETAISSIARQVVEIFGFNYCSVFAPESGRWDRVAIAGEISIDPAQKEIANAFLTGQLQPLDASAGLARSGEATNEVTLTYAPLKVGVRSIGVMILSSRGSERGTIEAIAGLVALALERARFLKEVSRTEALRQSDELKSALLASVSHDLRTPLTSIRASVDSLLDETIEWDRTTLREFHLIISEEVNRLTKLVKNLLEMARIEAGELKLSKRWESVSEIFNNVLIRCAPSISNHPVSVELGSSTPLVKVDSRLVAEALANLVENAAKYSPPGTEIVLSARIKDDKLIIKVKDQGIGIAREEAERVFDKFYRSARLPGLNTEGTGMGLSIARGLIEAHEGRVWVESELGKGATFSFAIPVEWKDSQATITEPQEQS